MAAADVLVPGRGLAFDGYVLEPAVERAYRQAKGEDPPEGQG